MVAHEDLCRGYGFKDIVNVFFSNREPLCPSAIHVDVLEGVTFAFAMYSSKRSGRLVEVSVGWMTRRNNGSTVTEAGTNEGRCKLRFGLWTS